MRILSKRSRSLVRSVTAFIVVAMVVSVAGVAVADEPSTVGPVYPWTTEWQEFTLDVGDTVLLGARWGACTRGLVQSARTALSFDYSLDDEPIAAEFAWTNPVAVPRHPDLVCVVSPNDDRGWRMTAEYPIVFDEPGDYVIGVVLTLSRPVFDGGDYDGDGRPDRFSGVLFEASSTVHVIAAP